MKLVYTFYHLSELCDTPYHQNKAFLSVERTAEVHTAKQAIDLMCKLNNGHNGKCWVHAIKELK